jgi:hypothetical protein
VLLTIGLGIRVRMLFMRAPQAELQPNVATVPVPSAAAVPVSGQPLPANAPPLPQAVA